MNREQCSPVQWAVMLLNACNAHLFSVQLCPLVDSTENHYRLNRLASCSSQSAMGREGEKEVNGMELHWCFFPFPV